MRFADHIGLQQVRQQTPDKRLAFSTWKASQERLAFAQTITIPKFTLENAYECIREAIDAILYAKGYKSYSHEATIAYLAELGFSQQEVNKVDQLRKHRNSIKYYGEEALEQEAKRALATAKSTIEKLERKNPIRP